MASEVGAGSRHHVAATRGALICAAAAACWPRALAGAAAESLAGRTTDPSPPPPLTTAAAAAWCASVEALEAEHLSLLCPAGATGGVCGGTPSSNFDAAAAPASLARTGGHGLRRGASNPSVGHAASAASDRANAPGAAGVWTPPVIDGSPVLFSWRVAVAPCGGSGTPASAGKDRGAQGAEAGLGRGPHGRGSAHVHMGGAFSPAGSGGHGPPRGVTQVDAVLTITSPGSAPVTCRPDSPGELRATCDGGASGWSGRVAARFTVEINVALRAAPTDSGRSTAGATAAATATGHFILGLAPTLEGWGGAEWVGLTNPNDTASQFRAEASLRSAGIAAAADVAAATLFVSGLGGHRASVNGRPLDPTAVRGAVTEWTNRTHYFADDVTDDVQRAAAAAASDRVVVAVELYKHWYGLANKFYPVPYGPRSLRAVLAVTHVNGTTAMLVPTCAASSGAGCAWAHGSGATLHEDLHTGQGADGRLATPGWDGAVGAAPSGWRAPVSVEGPPGLLRPHPMQRSRVLEIARPVNVSRVDGDPASGPGVTYRFTLPHEVAGFCTVLLPRGCPAGAHVKLRHGEAVDTSTGFLTPVECTKSLGPDHGLNCERTWYVCRGNGDGMDAHDQSWRRLALGGSTGAPDDASVEAFTPAFQFSAFRFVEVSYNMSVAPPDASVLACYRVGVGFDWTGDVAVAPPKAVAASAASSASASAPAATTAAERFNVVVAAARSSAVSNYLYDVPTDCPHREKRGWTGDSLAAHRALSAFFDVRAAWTKWMDDQVATQRALTPSDTTPTIVPCVFDTGACRGDPRARGRPPRATFADVAWGSLLPILGGVVADLTNDTRLAARVAPGAAAYVALLASYANGAASPFPQLLNASSWPGSNLGDWCAAESGGGVSVSSLLNSHHFILGADAAAALLRRGGGGAQAGGGDGPTAAQLEAWAATARGSFTKAFLHNISVPPPPPPPPPPGGAATCGSVPESTLLQLGCGGAGGAVITRVLFASYGLANGTCASGLSPSRACCENVTGAVAAACVGKPACEVECAPTKGKRVCAGADVPDPCGGVKKQLSVAIACSGPPPPPPAPPAPPVTGLAFRDPHPPNATSRPNNPPVAQTEASAGMAAMEALLRAGANDAERAALATTLAALVLGQGAGAGGGGRDCADEATVTGGVIDTAHLAGVLVRFGRPDAAFALLAADGQPSYYHMARFGGTLWENWDDADACTTPSGCATVGSLNHVMFAGSVGEAVFGVGGIEPVAAHGSGGRRALAPVPWMPDAPRGTAVWRSLEGVVSVSWAAASAAAGATASSGVKTANPRSSQVADGWQGRVWVNATVPPASTALLHVMLPPSATPGAVCAWECGLADPAAAAPLVDSAWVAFDNGGGHRVHRASPPADDGGGGASAPVSVDACAPVWRSGAAAPSLPAGVDGVAWSPARTGTAMFPSLALAVGSGTYAVLARPCGGR